MKLLAYAAIGFGLMVSLPSGANELTDASHAMCENMKRCTMQSIANDDSYPPEMKAMVEAQMQQSCEGMSAGYASIPPSHEMYRPATQCLQSMADQSCDEFDLGTTTPACKKFEEMGAKYGQ